MAKNILLTSLSASENDYPISYFSARNEGEFSRDYCEAVLSVEASTKYMLSRYQIDAIVVTGGYSTCDEGDALRVIPLKEGSDFYSADIRNLSTFSLYRYRIAQFIDGMALEQQRYRELLPEEEQEKIITFIRSYLREQGGDDGEGERLSRFFDDLAGDLDAYNQFKKRLFEAVPGAQDDARRYMRWTKNYLYSELPDSGKLEILPENRNVSAYFVPVGMTEKESGQRVDNMMELNRAVTDRDDEINLYVCLNSDDAADSFIVMNVLNIVRTMGDGTVHVQKVFTVSGSHRALTGEIHDDTPSLGITELTMALRSFVRYGKADLIVEFWEKSGERNERIADMIYALRHIDIGLSMCNLAEMEDGLIQLRDLFRGGEFHADSGYYGRLFNMIANGIRKYYGPLLEGDEIPFLDLVKWAYEHQFYQQTLTLIESRAPGVMVDKGFFYYCDSEENAEHITMLLAQQRMLLKPYEYYKIDEDLAHYFIKNYDRIRARKAGRLGRDNQESYAIFWTNSLKETDPEIIRPYTACDRPETVQNLLYAYYHIGDVRNKINHALENMGGKQPGAAGNAESPALNWLMESIDFFIDSYEKAVAEMEGKKPQVVKIPPSDVKRKAEELRRPRV